MGKIAANADLLFKAGVQHHQAGQLPQAEELYRQVLAQNPAHAHALHLLGVIAHQVGRSGVAVDLIRKAIVLQPDSPDMYSNLGLALQTQGQIEAAMAAFCQALALKPCYSEALYNLGLALQIQGQHDDAIAAYRQVLALKPNYPEAHNNLGNVLKDQGKLDAAVTAYRRTLALKPNYPEAHYNLGNVLKELGQLDAAVTSYRQALALKPYYPEAHNNLGNVFKDQGQFDAAITEFQHALALSPNYPEAHYNLGNVVKDQGQLDAAIAKFRRAIALNPDFPEAHNNLGIALKDQGQLDAAIAAFRQAVALKPNLPEGYHSNLVFIMNYHAGIADSAIAEEVSRWNQQHAEPLRQFIQPHVNDRTPDRRLRIGYVSPDFLEHPVGRFMLPLLAHHDQRIVEAYAYAQVAVPDALTARLQGYVSQWHSIVGLTDQQIAELIRRHQIDILVDLAGHTTGNRLLVFAHKPAPVQVTYLGYPGTTGLSTMDYRLTDTLADPPGLTEAFHREQLVRLPQCAWCYQFTDSLDLTPRPQRPITLGCFNNFAKVSTPVLKLWGNILLAVPGSRLLMKSLALQSPDVRERIQGVLGEQGVAPERLICHGYAPTHRDHLAFYNQVDIALDTFPYHGTTTTCEALWMGVPVVTLAGQSHVSRVGVSLLSNVGLPELIAQTPDQYVRIAAELAGDLPRLTKLRATLRQRMQASPLMDAPRFARDVESAYRTMWRTWCDQS